MKENEFGKKLDEDEFLGEENVSNKWEKYKGHYKDGDKKVLISKCIQAGIKVVFASHI